MIENSTSSAEKQPENLENNLENSTSEVEVNLDSSSENQALIEKSEEIESETNPTNHVETSSIETHQNQVDESSNLAENSTSTDSNVDAIESVSNDAETIEPSNKESSKEIVEESASKVSNVEATEESPVVSISQTISPAVEESIKTETSVEAEPTEEEIIVVDDHEMEAMEKEEEESAVEDYSGLNKEQLVTVAEQLNRDGDPAVAHRSIQKIKLLFETLFQKELQEAQEKYEADGGDPATFEFKHQSFKQRFEQAVKGIYDKRKINQEFQYKEKGKNLEAKLTLLEQLRKLVDDHEHTPGYDKFKEIREEWKKIGPVGSEHVQNLNASYFSLIDRFYSLSEIYHNLRDFDRKKNLEHKLELLAKIEKLVEEPKISKAMKDLMAYQDEYRSTGPVPKDRLDELKSRLKAAADSIYARRKAFNEERKNWLTEELALKDELIAKVVEFETFTASLTKDWQTKTKELLALQEEWKKIPNRFREKTGDLNKQFWTVFKKFMHNKNDFFKLLDKGKKDVLAQKQALVEEVSSLKDGEDFDGIANRMKEIQQEWKKIAPVFGKDGQKVYEDFKAGIDHFFGRLREQRSGEDKIQSDNLALKDTICAEIEALAVTGEATLKQIDELKDRFRNVGFVPMKSIQKINGRFSKAMIELIDSSKSISSNEKEKLKISLLSNRSTYSSEGVKTLKNQEGYIQKRLQQLRKEVGNLEDNMSMFKLSKNAMSIMDDYNKKINLSRLEIKELESQLQEIRNGE